MTTTVLAFIPSPSQGVWYLFGVVPLRAYALCIIAGIVAALIIGDRRWTARGGEQGVIYDIALWAVPFGLIGGRLYHVMTDWPKYFGADGAGFLAALRIWDGGLGIWGAVALGGVGAWIACRRRDIPLPAFGDAIAPGIILAQAIGRLGNYFNQELYGRETDLPWGLTIWERLDPSGVVSPHSLDGVSTGQVYAVVHPTFLYELLWNLLIFAMLLWADRRFKIGHGRLFALYVAGYCVGRFWVELMRSDTASLIAGIRVNTFTSMFVFIAAVIYIMVAPKGREDPTTLRGKAFDDGDGESAFDEVGEDLTAVAATSGLVAAAKVAGDDDSPPPETDSESAPASASADPEASLGSVEGDEAVQAEDEAAAVRETAVAAAADADSFADEVAADSESDGATEVAPDQAAERPAIALEGTEVAEALNADVEPEEGLGSVDGGEVADAQGDAAEVHQATAAGAEDAEAVAEDVAAEDESVVEDSTVAETEAKTAVEAVTADDATADEDAAPDDSTEGLGSVDADEVAAAEEAAPEVHDAAVEGAADAETAARTWPPRMTARRRRGCRRHHRWSGAVDAEDAATEDDVAPDEATEGLGSVDADEMAAAEEAAPEVHDAAVEGAADAETAAEDVVAEDDSAADEEGADGTTDGLGAVDAEDAATEDDAAPDEATEGLGSVDADEVAAAEEAAPEVKQAAVEGADDAAAVAEDIAAEPEREDEPAIEDSADTTTETAAEEATADEANAADDVTEDSTDGLGSEVAESAADDEPQTAEAVADDHAQASSSPRRRWWRRR